MGEWSIPADCKSVALTGFEGSNPSRCTDLVKSRGNMYHLYLVIIRAENKELNYEKVKESIFHLSDDSHTFACNEQIFHAFILCKENVNEVFTKLQMEISSNYISLSEIDVNNVKIIMPNFDQSWLQDMKKVINYTNKKEKEEKINKEKEIKFAKIKSDLESFLSKQKTKKK